MAVTTWLMAGLLMTACAKKPFHGTAPEAAVPAPTFTATAHDGTPRTRDDLLGSQRAQSMSGRTQYRGLEWLSERNLIRGAFSRVESRRGTFRMLRAGAAKSVGTKRTQEERLRDALGLDAGLDSDDRE